MDEGRDITSLLKLQEFLFSSPDKTKMDGPAFSEATGLTQEQIGQLVADGLLIPLEDGRYDPEDAAVARSLADALARGMDPADLAFYGRLAVISWKTSFGSEANIPKPSSSSRTRP